jgi:dihydrofolate reductase
MIGSTNGKIILGRESLETVEGVLEMTLSYDGRSVTAPARVHGPDEAGRVTLAPENAELTGNVVHILEAYATGLRITMIAAADDEWGVGVEGRLPWRNAADLRHFRQRTLGRHLLMGRTTFEGLPKTLDGRTIHVLSRGGPEHLTSVDRAIHSLLSTVQDEIVVAGGAKVYEQALPFCTHAEITRIPGTHGCDAFMPDLRAAGWTLAATETLADDITIEHWERQK